MDANNEIDEERLKRLLLGSELDCLKLLHRRVGDDKSLQASMQRVLVDVLREVGTHNHARLSAVLSPLVLYSLREEIRNSRDLMIDALYPITGRLVKTSVQNAFRQLIDTLNKRLNESFSLLGRWRIRLQAKIRGISEAELLLKQEQPFDIQELILLHRTTGLLIAHIGTPLEEEHTQFIEQATQDVDSDLVGGMLTAIISFTKDAFGGQEGDELNTLAFGDSELCLQMSPAIIMAVRVRGTQLPGFKEALEDLFTTILEQWGDLLRNFDGSLVGDEAFKLQEDLRQRFRQLTLARQNNFRSPSRKGIILIIFIACTLLLWVSWSSYKSWKSYHALHIVQQTINAHNTLTDYPLNVEINEAGHVQITGMVPNNTTLNTLRTKINQVLPGYTIKYQIIALPWHEITQIRTDLDATQEKTAQISSELLAHTIKLQNIINTLTKTTTNPQLAASLNTLQQVQASLMQRLTSIEDELMSPTQLLLRWINYNSISFKQNTAFAYPEQAQIKLKTLANLLAKAPQQLRIKVVGYTDILGNNALNQWLALQRSLVVIEHLTRLGVPRKRLLSIGKYTEHIITKDPIETTHHRRIKFELIP